MPEFEKKSKKNSEAAELLIKNNIFAPSIHCNYYCVFQYIKSILSVGYQVSYTQQTRRTRGKDSHKEILSILKEQLRNSNVNEEEINTIIDVKHKSLKALRKKADYKNIVISKELADESTNLRNDLIKFLER